MTNEEKDIGLDISIDYIKRLLIYRGMKTPIPTLEKTPFALDTTPLAGNHTSRAGAGLIARIFRSLKLPAVCEANLPHHRRTRNGFSPAQYIESISVATLLGIDRLEDIDALREDDALSRVLGYQPPSARSTRDFLEKFHDQERVEQARQRATEKDLIAFIPDANPMHEGLQRVLGSSARACAEHGEPKLKAATVDADATVVESWKRSATFAYTGVKGYQPVVAMWAEADAVLAAEFRDGNVPARYRPANCVKAAFRALPTRLSTLAFRGDSACYEDELLRWLCDEQREDGPKGRIDFAVSAVMSPELKRSSQEVQEKQWTTFGVETDGVVRQWAELDFVPAASYEKKDSHPLRFVGLRIVKPQGELFEDGSAHKHFAICTNRTLNAEELIQWHRAKAGTIEHVHDELKNGLAAAAMPSKYFGANAAWFLANCIAYNLASVLRAAVPDPDYRTARVKRLRFHFFNVTGRIVRDRRKISLRLAAPRTWIAMLVDLFEHFALRTVSTG